MSVDTPPPGVHTKALLGIEETVAGEEKSAEGTKGGRRENLCQDVCDHGFGRDVTKFDGAGGHLVPEPPHAHGEVAVAGRHDRVGSL